MPNLLARMSRKTPDKSGLGGHRGNSSGDVKVSPQEEQSHQQHQQALTQATSLNQRHSSGAKPPPYPKSMSHHSNGDESADVRREETTDDGAGKPSAARQAELPLIDRRLSTVVMLGRQTSAKSTSSLASINPDKRDMVKKARRIIVKASTKVISRACDGRLALSRIGNMVEQLESLIRAGREIILVTSGATCSGKQRLKREQILNNTPLLHFQGLEMGHNVPHSVQRQAAAASGQSALMGLYDQMFGQMDIAVAQLLLGRGDLQHADQTQGLKETVDYLLSINTIPIINWNDAIFTDAVPGCGTTGAAWAQDNNHLASTLAEVLDAELLVLLSNTDGLHTKAKEPIPAYCPDLHQKEVDMSCGVCPALVCENVASKIDCAWAAAEKGIPALILNGKGTDPAILRAVSGDVIGTLFDAEVAEHLMRERCRNCGDNLSEDESLADGMMDTHIMSRKVSDSVASLGGSDDDQSLKDEVLSSNEQ